MRIDAISSDPSRSAIAASRVAPAQTQRPAAQQATKVAAPAKDADGDSDGDMGTKGGLLDIGA